VPLYVWIALLLLAAAISWGIAVVATRALALWRTFKTFGSAMGETVSGVEAATERLARNSETLGSGLPKVEASVARLRADLARLAVLRQAVQDARDSFGWILAVYPRK
jgi:hypothetical protein